MYSTRRLRVRQDIRPRKVLFVASMQQPPYLPLMGPNSCIFINCDHDFGAMSKQDCQQLQIQ
jgi:hypothetical protein